MKSSALRTWEARGFEIQRTSKGSRGKEERKKRLTAHRLHLNNDSLTRYFIMIRRRTVRNKTNPQLKVHGWRSHGLLFLDLMTTIRVVYLRRGPRPPGHDRWRLALPQPRVEALPAARRKSAAHPARRAQFRLPTGSPEAEPKLKPLALLTGLPEEFAGEQVLNS